MADTKIEWAQKSWNVVTGCSKISEGCHSCYAERMSHRLAGRYGYPPDEPFQVTFHPDKLDEPLRWKKPRRIFVCSMGDIFHDDVQVDWIDSIFGVINQCPQHIFMFLTKRPQNIEEKALAFYTNPGMVATGTRKLFQGGFPKNVWVGCTVENQARADERIPILLQIPAAVHFVSVEPMLGPVDIEPYGIIKHGTGGEYTSKREYLLDWVIAGGESGPGARPVHPDWPRSLRDQCQAAGVPFFFKGWGEWGPAEDGGCWIAEDGRWFKNRHATLNAAGDEQTPRYCPNLTWG